MGRKAVIDKQQRMLDFRDLFKDCPNYGLSSTYFEDTSNGRESTFDRHCDKIIESWKRKWHPQHNITNVLPFRAHVHYCCNALINARQVACAQ